MTKLIWRWMAQKERKMKTWIGEKATPQRHSFRFSNWYSTSTRIDLCKSKTNEGDAINRIFQLSTTKDGSEHACMVNNELAGWSSLEMATCPWLKRTRKIIDYTMYFQIPPSVKKGEVRYRGRCWDVGRFWLNELMGNVKAWPITVPSAKTKEKQ